MAVTAGSKWHGHGSLHWLGLSFFLALFGFFYIFLGDKLILQTNRDPARSDQSHNMTLAMRAQATQSLDFGENGFSGSLKKWAPHYTDGVVNPLWPWISAWVIPQGTGVSEPGGNLDRRHTFFQRGKWLNLLMTGGFVLVLGMVVGWNYSLVGTINLVVLAGLGAFLPRSAYFQPEPLYYMLFFLTWACGIVILRKNSLWLYAVMGLFSGLAYLAKGSVTPLLIVFLIAGAYRFLATLFPPLLFGFARGQPETEWSCRNHFLGLVFFAFAFITTAGPRLEYANRYYGDPFHSYPKYWMWMDDFSEGFTWMNEHPTRARLKAIPDNERPGPRRYFRTHSVEEVEQRFRNGVGHVFGRFFTPPRQKVKKDKMRPWKQLLPLRGYYLGWLALSFVILAIIHARNRPADPAASSDLRLRHAAFPIMVFVFGSFLTYAAAYAWYVPIGKGDRFMLSLYAPLAFSLISASEHITLRVRRTGGPPGVIRVHLLLQCLLTAALAHRIYELARSPYFVG